MKPSDACLHLVRWSDEDQRHIGYCPDLYFGGVCHGKNEEQVYAELCVIIGDEIEHRRAKGEVLPVPSARVTRDVDLVVA